jgi:hypothetical protein
MRCRPHLPVLILASAVVLAGCTRPAVAPKPLAFQPQADALRDWEAAAKQIAMDMTTAGLLLNPAVPNAQPVANVYFINVLQPKSQFLHELAGSLTSEIVQRGGIVQHSPIGAQVVDLDVDLVQWAGRHRLPDGTLSAAGLAGGAAVVLGNQAPLTPAAGFGLLAGAGILADIVRTMTPTTNTEIAWGASISAGDRVVFSDRYPMYVAEADAALYVGLPDPPPLPPGPPAIRVRYAP